MKFVLEIDCDGPTFQVDGEFDPMTADMHIADALEAAARSLDDGNRNIVFFDSTSPDQRRIGTGIYVDEAKLINDAGYDSWREAFMDWSYSVLEHRAIKDFHVWLGITASNMAMEDQHG
jgi:hypothetical protein